MDKQEIFRYISCSFADSKRYTSKYSGPENPFVLEKGKKIAISWSGGKDSCYVFHKAKDFGLEVKYLFNLTNKEDNMSLTWAYNLDFIKEQARQLGVPLITIPSDGRPASELFSDFFDRLKSEGIETIGAGYYIYNGQREFFQELLYPKGMSMFEPNLGKDQKEHMKEIMRVGIVPRIVSVNTEEIPVQFLGREADTIFYNYMASIKDFTDFCGENSSFQTIAVNCKYFEKPIEFQDCYRFQVGAFRIHYYF